MLNPCDKQLELGSGLFLLPGNWGPSKEVGAALIFCHPELAKDLAERRGASCHPSAFSKLTASFDEPSVPTTRRLKRMSGPPRDIPSTDSGQALRKLPMNLPVEDRRSAPTARPQCSLGQRPRSLSHNGLGLKARNKSRSTHCARPTASAASFAEVLGRCPTAIKLKNSRSRSQAPAWERPCLGGSSLPFLSGAPCFWRPGRRLEPPGILHSQAGAWERARVTRASKLNLMAVGRCPRLHCGWAVGPERRQAIPGSCPTINVALWPPASLRMTAFGAASSLVGPVCKPVGNPKRGLPQPKTPVRSSIAPTGFDTLPAPISA